MNSKRTDETEAYEDTGIEQLLREVGARSEPEATTMQAVRASVHAEWQAVVARRKRRKYVDFSIAAGIATAVLGATLLFNYAPTSKTPTYIATVAKLSGDLQTGVVQVSDNGSTWRDVVVGERLATGDQLRTAATAGAALDLGNGLSLRVDAASLCLLKADRVVLDRGRVYVDASSQTGQHSQQQSSLIVQTSFGSIAHLGTQYQVQLVDNKLVVSVREGRVAYRNGQVQLQAKAGERVEIDTQGKSIRHAISPNDASWQWAVHVAPAFDIENQSLARFLEWVGRETGRTVSYATPAVRQQANALVLRGSIDELNPEQALTAVLATTNFVHTARNTSIDIRL